MKRPTCIVDEWGEWRHRFLKRTSAPHQLGERRTCLACGAQQESRETTGEKATYRFKWGWAPDPVQRREPPDAR